MQITTINPDEKASNNAELPLGEIRHKIEFDEYAQRCLAYARNCNWVRPDEEPFLLERYLRPIFTAYEDALKTVDDDLIQRREESQEHDERMATISRRLNSILESTRRIGSATKDDILSSIQEKIRGWNTSSKGYDWASGYATEAVLEKVVEVLNRVD